VAWDHHLEIELSEAPNEATLGAVRLNGQPLAVTLQADGFTLRSDQPLPLGDHLLEIETTLTDRAGRPLEPRFDAAFTWDGTTEALAIFKAESDTTPTNLLRRSRADKDLVADLTGLNLGFQGQPYDPETGLYYFRNRYYDPELGRFLTADPLGYVDGPSLYAFAGNDPVNGRDPLGLQMGGPPMAYSAQQYVVSGQAAADVQNAGRQGASLVAGFVPGVGEVHDASQALTGIDPITGEVLSNGQRVIAGAAVVAPVAGRRFFEGALDWLGKRGEDLAGWFGRLGARLPFGSASTKTPTTLAKRDFSNQGGEFLDDFATGAPPQPSGAQLQSVPDDPTVYSNAFEMQLTEADLGRSRSIHFNRANAALDEALSRDPDLTQALTSLIPGLPGQVSRNGGRQTPAGWVWHHVPSSQADGRQGVLRLVPASQHTPGSAFWDVLHPGGAGGYSEWAIPAGAPRN
jgi:RHS repeat-associated protein